MKMDGERDGKRAREREVIRKVGRRGEKKRGREDLRKKMQVSVSDFPPLKKQLLGETLLCFPFSPEHRKGERFNWREILAKNILVEFGRKEKFPFPLNFFLFGPLFNFVYRMSNVRCYGNGLVSMKL